MLKSGCTAGNCQIKKLASRCFICCPAMREHLVPDLSKWSPICQSCDRGSPYDQSRSVSQNGRDDASNAHFLPLVWCYHKQEGQNCSAPEPFARRNILCICPELGQQVPCAHGRPIPLQPETYSLLSRLIFAHRIRSEIVPVVVIMVPPFATCSRFPPEQLMLPLLHSLLPCRLG